MEQPILEVEGLHRRFGGLTAVEDVSLSVKRGTIVGLIGPNGSGKTTTFNLVSGIIKPHRGNIRLFGEDVTGRQPYEIVARGLVRTFQQVRLFPEMTAVENVMVARNARAPTSLFSRLPLLPAARRLRRSKEVTARKLLERVGMVENQDVLARKLGFLHQHLVEIARALATGAQILLLDEPSTGMVASEVATLQALIRSIRADGMAVVIVEHNMPLIMNECERITVLNLGRVIAEGTPTEIAIDSQVIEAYLGKA